MRRASIVALGVLATGALFMGAGLVQRAVASSGPAVAATSGSVAAAEERRQLTLRFEARELTPNVIVDVGQPGNSVGDSVIEHETLFRNGRQIGHDTLQCTAIHGPPQFDFQCVGTLVFADGEVTLQGATDFSEIRVAVTGGTGRYQGAYGQLVVHGTKTTTDNDVASLVLPAD
jgi:hypothetical protein